MAAKPPLHAQPLRAWRAARGLRLGWLHSLRVAAFIMRALVVDRTLAWLERRIDGYLAWVRRWGKRS